MCADSSAGTSNVRGAPANQANARAGPAPRAEVDDIGEEEILAAGRIYAAHVQDGQARRQEAEHVEVIRNMRARELANLERTIAARNREARRRQREGDDRDLRQRARDISRYFAQDERLAVLREEVGRDRRNATLNLVRRHGRGTRRDIIRRGVWDPEDRVRRCVDCSWEIENNRCQHW